MFNVKEKENKIEFELSSQLNLIDRIISDTRDFISRAGISGNITGVEHVIRELILNAIEHGNKGKPEKKVKCVIEIIESERLKITVTDQGKGFDYKKMNFSTPLAPEQTRSRGYPIINAYSDEIEFGEKGNQVSVYIIIKKETDFQIEEKDKDFFITPSGDISAAIAESFRQLLVGIIDKKPSKIKFDFQRVLNIDSIALSVFISLSQSCLKEGTGTSLEIININNDLQDLFRLTRMNELYKIIPKK